MEKIILLVVLSLALTACPGGGGGGSPAAAFTSPDGSLTPADPADEITGSVLADYGFAPSEFSLDFSTFQIGVPAYQRWYMYAPGQHGVDGQEIRRCRATIVIQGDELSGTITVSGSEWIWKLNTSEPSTFCEANDGVYPYEVTAEGIEIDGILYEAVE